MKRVADIIAETLAAAGAEHIFMVTGGGAMHLNDAFGRCKGLTCTFTHHEQAAAMAAQSYGRLSGKLAVANPTTGPGGLNALNGVSIAYGDSTAMVVVSGQVKRETLARNSVYPLRQLGYQEVDIVSIARPITKYATVLQDPEYVLEVVQKAIFIARNGRPGPVWIDVPGDVAGAMVDESCLRGFAPTPSKILALQGDPELAPNTLGDFNLLTQEQLFKPVAQIIEQLRRAKRPVLMGGSGVRLAGLVSKFFELSELLGIPTIRDWSEPDLIPNTHHCYAGRPGVFGDRAGNFAIQHADFLLILGSNLDVYQTSFAFKHFAPHAWKAQVDTDPSILHKHTLYNDMTVHADLLIFIPLILDALKNWKHNSAHEAYRVRCKKLVEQYPVLQEKHCNSIKINPYNFLHKLFAKLHPDEIIISAISTPNYMGFQIINVQENTRCYADVSGGTMGYDLPAAIGAAMTRQAKRIICLAGDGCIMMNLQELQTIIGNKLPIIIFVCNNNGYLAIRETQKAYFPDNRMGTEPENGLTFPDFMKVAQAFGFKGRRIEGTADLEAGLAEALADNGPSLYEVMLDPDQGCEPKVVSYKREDGTMVSPPLEDMSPLLPRDELARIMADD